MRAAVVGHLEWVEFVRVEHVPQPGEIVHALEQWEEPAGGGPAAAEQLRKLGADTSFYTSLGNDELGHRAYEELSARGLRVHAAFRPEPTRRAITHVDSNGERTITVLGTRLAARGSDELPWADLEEVDAVYFTAGDAGALRAARAARVLVATARVLDVLTEAGVQLDALVGSAVDPGESFAATDVDPQPRLSVRTDSERGGRFSVAGGELQHYQATPPNQPVIDRYGAGDSFVAGLTYGLGAGATAEDAIALGARCGAAALTGRGPYQGQLKDAGPIA